MFKQMFDMPPGTIGFEAVGEIDDDDFEDVVAPVLRQQIAGGHFAQALQLAGALLNLDLSRVWQGGLRLTGPKILIMGSVR